MLSSIISSMHYGKSLTSTYLDTDFVFNITRSGRILNNIKLNSLNLRLGDVINYSASNAFKPKNSSYNGGTPVGFIGVPTLTDYTVKATDKKIPISFTEVPYYNISYNTNLQGQVSVTYNNAPVTSSTNILLNEPFLIKYTRPSGKFYTVNIKCPDNRTFSKCVGGLSYTIQDADAANAIDGKLSFTITENTDVATITTSSSGFVKYTHGAFGDITSKTTNLAAGITVAAYFKAKSGTSYLKNIAIYKNGSPPYIIFDEQYSDEVLDSETRSESETPSAGASYEAKATYVTTKVTYPSIITLKDGSTTITSGSTGINPGKDYSMSAPYAYNNLRLFCITSSSTAWSQPRNLYGDTSSSGNYTAPWNMFYPGTFKLKAYYTQESNINNIRVFEAGDETSTEAAKNLSGYGLEAEYDGTTQFKLEYTIYQGSNKKTGTATITAPKGGGTVKTAGLGGLCTASLGSSTIMAARGSVSYSFVSGVTYAKIICSKNGATATVYQ